MENNNKAGQCRPVTHCTVVLSAEIQSDIDPSVRIGLRDGNNRASVTGLLPLEITCEGCL
jgi:hypothetical protein